MIKRLRRRDRPTERDLAALADGSLSPTRRARVERAVAASPELHAELHAQRVALAAVRDLASERAPASLRARVALARPARRPVRRVGALAVAGTAAVAAAAVLTLGGPATTPSAADAAVLGARAPGAPAPQAADGRPVLRGPRGAGLPFPYWQDHFGWKAIGQRHDRLDGRPATTVFYRHRGQVIAYTIVGGAPLQAGTPARTTVLEGTVIRAFAAHQRHVVTWLRRGHTCVLAGTSAADATLLRLAAWRGGGDIPY